MSGAQECSLLKDLPNFGTLSGARIRVGGRRLVGYVAVHNTSPPPVRCPRQNRLPSKNGLRPLRTVEQNELRTVEP